MHICLITEYFPESVKREVRGGVEARAFYVAQELSKKHPVTVLTSHETGKPRIHFIGNIKVIRCGKHVYSHQGKIFSRLRFAWSVWQAKSLLADDVPNIIEGENFICYLPAFALAKKFKAKAVATYHEVWIGSWKKNKGRFIGTLGEWWEKLVLSKPWDHIIAVSKFTKNKLVANNIPAKKITVIPNGVDLSQYPPLNEDNPHLKYPYPTICCIARLTKNKRVEDILLAMVKLRSMHKGIQLKIIGVGAEEHSLRLQAEELGLAKQVSFLGFVPSHLQLVQILSRSHIFCSASIVEGFGMALLEAMACGTPYVASRIPPFQEITDNGKGGLLFKPKNVEDLAAKIDFLLARPEEYARRAKEAKSYVRQFDWETIAKKLMTVYEDIYVG